MAECNRMTVCLGIPWAFYGVVLLGSAHPLLPLREASEQCYHELTKSNQIQFQIRILWAQGKGIEGVKKALSVRVAYHRFSDACSGG